MQFCHWIYSPSTLLESQSLGTFVHGVHNFITGYWLLFDYCLLVGNNEDIYDIMRLLLLMGDIVTF